MRRVIILGPGASGKSTLARHLGQITKLPVIELDKVFWRPDLVPPTQEEWVKIQSAITANDEWILDGDLGPYDVVDIRLSVADTIIFLDFSLIRCAWSAVRRSREQADFWIWLLRYRQTSRPLLMEAIARLAPDATVHVLRTPKAVRRFIADALLDQPERPAGELRKQFKNSTVQ